MDSPLYSVVVTSRNDGHGGNIMKRMRLFTNGLLQQSRRHKVPMELIFVEWNPPADRPLLKEVLPAPGKDDCMSIRYILVPERIQKGYKLEKEVPLFQMIAKNVGIRRAKANWILCTNIDLLFSDNLFQRMARQELVEGHFYRANRCDVPDGLDESWDLDRQLQYCEGNIMRRLGWDSRFKHVNLEESGLKHKTFFMKWFSNEIARFHRLLSNRFNNEYYRLDKMACGDFTLMSKSMWEDIQGYLELDMYSIHVDSLGLIAAKALGYTQVVLPREACSYHIDHPQGWEAMNPLEKLKFLERRPGIGYGVLLEVAKYILEQKTHLNLNPSDWGFANEDFEEYELLPGVPQHA